VSLLGQNAQPAHPAADIIGTVTDTNGGPLANATVVLQSADGQPSRTVTTPANGFFDFQDVRPGVSFQISVKARNFADWKSPAITLAPGQFKILTRIRLQIPTALTHVQVTYNPAQVATEQFQVQENQRVFGVIPNFYVSYAKHPAPLTAKMKFKLALKVSVDPITVAGVLIVSGAKQAANSPNYGQGWGAFGERVGAVSADGFTDIMIGGAILPSLLHQDPRYFYDGQGSIPSRTAHAMSSPFVARGDNGKPQPNYSTLGGILASAAIANAYYPSANRGAQLTFENFAIGAGERVGADLAQEFLLARFTHRHRHHKP